MDIMALSICTVYISTSFYAVNITLLKFLKHQFQVATQVRSSFPTLHVQKNIQPNPVKCLVQIMIIAVEVGTKTIHYACVS